MTNTIRFEELLESANRDFKDGYYENAVQKLEDILTEDPTFGKAYNHLGWFYETKAKDYKKAEKFYKLALEYAPEYLAVYNNYTILLSNLKQFDRLKPFLEQALKVPGIDKANIYNEFGIMCEQQQNFNKAIEYYKKCLLGTLNNDKLKNAQESIKRCETKLNLL